MSSLTQENGNHELPGDFETEGGVADIFADPLPPLSAPPLPAEEPGLDNSSVGQSPSYKYPSAYRGLAAAFDDLNDDHTSGYAPEYRTSPHHTPNDDLSLIDPFVDELEQEDGHETVAFRGLQWLRRNVSSLRVTVSLQRTPPSRRKPTR